MAGEEREPLVIASNKPLKDWQQFLVESVDDLEHAEELADSEIYCVAIAALCKDGNAITAYKDTAAQDKAPTPPPISCSMRSRNTWKNHSATSTT